MKFFTSLFGPHRTSEENKFETLRDDGVRAMQMGELPYAEKCFKAALDFKRDLKTVSYLAEVSLRQQNYEQALPLLEELAQAQPDAMEVELLLAQTQGKLQRYADERNTADTLTTQYPGEPRALYLAAEADHGLGEDLPAIEHLTRCLSLRPDYSQALLLRTQIYADTEQWTEALSDVQELIKGRDGEENEDYHLLRSRILHALGREAEAIADLQKARLLNPFNTTTVLQLGQMLEAESRPGEALSLYNESIEQQPDFTGAYEARARVKRSMGNETGADADEKKALEMHSRQSQEPGTDDYTNVENLMNEKYRNMNPYKF